jgi:EmrB/QacA subfamily drug resistance transporter
MRLLASTPAGQAAGSYPRRWWALLVLCLSLLLDLMANSSLIVAAPSMTRDLNLSSSDLEWVIDAYTIPYAALMLVFGTIGDKYSRRGALIAGLLVFGAGSAAGSLVHSTASVIAARAVMGIGAAIIMPSTLSLLVAIFPRRERARAITAWTATSGLAVALGPLLAGWLLEGHSWHSVFLMNVPIAAVAVVAALVLVPPSRAANYGRTDIIGGLLSVVTVGALVYMIIEGPHFGWGAAAITAAAVAGAGLAAFVAWELRFPNPMLKLRMFRDRGLAGATIAVLLFFLATFGTVFYIPQEFQFVMGYSPLATGARLLPLAAGVFAGAAVTGWLTRQLGLKIVVPAGMALGAAAIFLLTRVADQTGYLGYWPALALLGVAIGLAASPATDRIMAAFPEAELGVGGGVNDTAIELGAALGIAILGSALSTSYKNTVTPLLAGHLPAGALHAAADSVGGALAIAQQAALSPAGGPAQAQALIAAADHAFTHAVAHTSLIGAVIVAAGTVVVALVLPRRRVGRADVAGVPGLDTPGHDTPGHAHIPSHADLIALAALADDSGRGGAADVPWHEIPGRETPRHEMPRHRIPRHVIPGRRRQSAR